MSDLTLAKILAIEDIALEILPCLELKDLFVLRCVNRELKFFRRYSANSES